MNSLDHIRQYDACIYLPTEAYARPDYRHWVYERSIIWEYDIWDDDGDVVFSSRDVSNV